MLIGQFLEPPRHVDQLGDNNDSVFMKFIIKYLHILNNSFPFCIHLVVHDGNDDNNDDDNGDNGDNGDNDDNDDNNDDDNGNNGDGDDDDSDDGVDGVDDRV